MIFGDIPYLDRWKLFYYFERKHFKYNLTYMCSSMHKVALCLQAHNLKNATVRILTKRFNNSVQKNLAHATVIRIANA